MRKERFSVLVVRVDAELPPLPENLRSWIEIERVETLDDPEVEIPIEEFELYKIIGAKADFRGKGIKLLAHHTEKPVRWMNDALMVFGINGHGNLKLNHHFCVLCQDNTRIKEDVCDYGKGIRIIRYVCPIHSKPNHPDYHEYRDIVVIIPLKKQTKAIDFDSSTVRRSTNPRHSYNRKRQSIRR